MYSEKATKFDEISKFYLKLQITYYRKKKFGGFVILLAQESSKVSLHNRLVGRIRFKIKVLGYVFNLFHNFESRPI